MSEEIRVTLVHYGDRPNLVMAYTDPVSGQRRTKSAGTYSKKDAWKKAAEWEQELRAGPLCPPSKVTWADFRRRYEEEHLATLAPQTVHKAGYALDRVERYLNPDRLCKLTAGALSTFQMKLRDTGAKDTTVAAVLRHVKAALSWAVSVGMLTKVPKVVMPKRAKGRKMKGGALLGEQFDRMLAAVPKIRPHDAPEWIRYINGLWLSGLRLQESVDLSWDTDAGFAVDLSGRRPRFRIKGESQKSRKDELLPFVPDFAEFLLRTPEGERHGRVFRLNHARRGTPLAAMAVGKLITKIGRKAGVSVDGKTASAHDLRRTFGTRWSRKVMPAVLQRLMRHADIATTMGYYVDLDTDVMADELWANHPATAEATPAKSNISGNKRPIPVPALAEGVDANRNE